MNKDLPVIIRKVFSNLDPLIWQGVWLYTLETLLSDPRMFDVWEEFVEVLKNKHLKGSNLKLNQYMKWELKAFVAQIVEFRNKHINTSGKTKELSSFLSNYFAKKEIDIDETHNLIKVTSQIICT
jgi:hypothetical protein|tara:strand:- start:258 stop:632 length:375 start_codon:yes stop_codon:yes gene_type:complete